MCRVACAVLWGLLFAGVVSAQEVDVPPDLEAWRSWVMHGEEHRRCPLRPGVSGEEAGAYVCSWPGRLRISVTAGGGEFSQRWEVHSDSWVALPGDSSNWPEEVLVNGRPASVTAREALPHLRLTAGEYSVSGKFTWSRRPESLRIPPSTALVDLDVDRRAIAPVELRGDRLWLGAVRTVTVPRALQVQVYRLLQDGIPLLLTTQLHLKVSGDAREEFLARALPEGFVPIATGGVLPMRFEPDGKLRIQVRSGEHVVTIIARAVDTMQTVTLPQADGLWADEEIWSYRSDDRLRVTAIESAPPIDPVQAGVPMEWRQLPTYRLTSAAGVTIAQRTRGLNSADANRLSLYRDLWLAFDHEDFLAEDRVGGTMQQGWRLDMQGPYRLLSARRGEEALLITDGAQGRTGIELRTPNVDVATLSRIERNGSQPATGWDARFENVHSVLHLPPGHRLFAAWGVDEAPDSWVAQWRLLDLFLLMLVTVAAYRLLGAAGAALAAGAVALTYHELLAPSWLWVNLLIAIALASVVPEGRLRKWAHGYRAVALAVLVLALIPFAILQYRLAVHPQLSENEVYPMPWAAPKAYGLREDMPQESAVAQDAVATSGDGVMELRMAAPESPPPPKLEMPESVSGALLPKRLERYAPDAMLQTGPGIPQWRFLSYRLNWSGPVDSQQTVRFSILSPLWLSLWRLVGLGLSLLLLLALIRLAYGWPKQWQWPQPKAASAAGAVVLAMLLAGQQRAEAATPDAQLLGELKNRLTSPPKCAPQCADIIVANVSVSSDRLEVQMQVHAQAEAVVGMPQAGPQWAIERVTIDDRATDVLARADTQQLQLPVSPGVHRVSMVGKVVQAYELTLEFAQPPHRIAVRTEGWDSSGSSEGRLLNNALQLTRRAGTAANQQTLAPQRFAAFVRVHRRVFMNLDWTVITQVERLAPQEGAFTLRLPLLPGESVLTPGLEVRDDHVLISMPAGGHYATWESSLSRVDKTKWSAAADVPWVERWEIIVSPMWHADFAGTPPIMPSDGAAEAWVNEFLPRPGESLDVSVSRPAASAGATLAVDQANVVTEFGKRLSSTSLEFGYRSSQGGRHDLHLPPDARVESVMFDGQSVPLRPTDGVLPLTLTPGRHQVSVRFSRDAGVGFISKPPAIDLGIEASNVRTALNLAEDRWVLFAWGPGVGPAILYWGELILFALVAVALGRLRRTPLTTRDWLLLGLGLSTFSWWVLLTFGAWLFVLDSRERWRIDSPARFNLAQIGLGIASVAALATLVSAIPFGLLGRPDMGIVAQHHYSGVLTWFMDRTGSQLPQPGVISVSIWFYKLAMLLWALWLSFALLRWLPWAWRRYSLQGLWRGRVEVPATNP